MFRIQKTVFLSYRRADNGWARGIYEWLKKNGYDVFFDHEGIGSGSFESIIIENIRTSAHFIVLLTPTALDRCDEPRDWLRREIETAISLKRNVVPIMLSGFDFGSPAVKHRLTGTLAPLAEYNGCPVLPHSFESDMQRLVTLYMSKPIESISHPRSVLAMEAATEQQHAADAEMAKEQVSQLRLELADAKAKLSAFQCPHCEAPIEVRVFHQQTGFYQGKDYDYDIEYVEYLCGYATRDGVEDSPCKGPLEDAPPEPEPPERELRD